MSKRSGGKRFHVGAFSLSKKSACGGLFRQKLKKCLRPGAQTPRPPGKAGRYEFTLADLRVLQTSPLSLLRVSAAANHPRRPLFLSRRGADGRFWPKDGQKPCFAPFFR